MKNQYEYTINSTEDISRALAEADREGYDLTHYNSAFYLRGTAGESIFVDDSLAHLCVTTYGPAPVLVSGEGEVTVRAEENAVVYATGGSLVDAYDSATVYAYDRSQVDVSVNASVYVSSDGVDVEAFGNSKVYLPGEGASGSRAWVHLEGDAELIQSADVPMGPTN